MNLIFLKKKKKTFRRASWVSGSAVNSNTIWVLKTLQGYKCTYYKWCSISNKIYSTIDDT